MFRNVFICNDDLNSILRARFFKKCTVQNCANLQNFNSIHRSPVIARVFLIDIGTLVTLTTAKLFELPENFKNFDPLVCNLQVVNLVPLDAEEFWDEDTKNECSEMMERMIDSFTFTCKTELAIHDILITESFDAKDRILGTIKFRFKNTMLKDEMCVEDLDVLVKLRKMAVADEEVKLQEIKDEVEVKEIEGIEETTKTEDRWKQLSWNSYYEVCVTQYQNPESFLAVPDITGSRSLIKALQEIETYVGRTPLESYRVGAVCGVNGTKIRRGKIVKIIDETVDVLLVDAGEIKQYQKIDLIKLPAELITKIPFQTISCRMLGIKPKFNMNVWPPKQRQAVHELIMSYHQPLKIFVVKTSTRSEEMGMNCYDMFLIDRESGLYLDEVAVKNRIADRDVNVKKSSCIDSGNVSDNTDGDVEILRQLLKKQINGDEDEEEISEHELTADEEFLEVETVTQPKSSSAAVTSLDYIHKHPHIEWRQNETMIYLLITAIDCEDYALRLDDISLEVTIKYKENFIEKAVIQFYSRIDLKLCSHEIRGLNLIVRMPKKVLDCQWPRLTETRERSQFIKFSAEKISTEIEEKQLETLLPKVKSNYAGLLPDGLEDEFDSYSEESFSPSDAEDYT